MSVLLCAGCSTGAGDPAAEGAADSLLPAAEGTTEYPLTLETPFGETVLEERPERIAVVSPSTVDFDSLVALDVVPVLAPDTAELEPWVPDAAISGVESFWAGEPGALPSPEQVAAAEPDLIVALQAPETFGQAEFDQVSAIAPVLMSDPSGPPLSWEDITEQLAGVLDLGDAAEALTAGVERGIDDLASRNPQFAGKTAAHVHVYSQQYGAAYFSFPGSDSAALLESLGFEIPENASKFTDESAISDELVGDIEADVLLLTVNPSNEGAGWFTDQPLFQSLPAVEEGRYAVYEPDEGEQFAAFAWAIRMQSPLSLPWAAETLEGLANEAIG